MARFTQYPAASTTDYAEATTFLIANEDGEIKQASLEGLRSNFGCEIQCASLTIASADVLTLNTTPLTIVPAVAGYAIEVVSASRKLDFNTTPYATNTILQLITSGATSEQAQAKINSSVSNNLCMDKSTPGSATSTQLIANADLQVTVQTGNPTAGDSDIEVFVLYRVINV